MKAREQRYHRNNRALKEFFIRRRYKTSIVSWAKFSEDIQYLQCGYNMMHYYASQFTYNTFSYFFGDLLYSKRDLNIRLRLENGSSINPMRESFAEETILSLHRESLKRTVIIYIDEI